MASYQALLGTKHWNDGPRRAAEPNYEWQLWAAGRIASADAALTLLESRARKAAAPLAPGEANPHPWPEFAEQNCFTCHQSLRTAAGPATTPGAITLVGGVPLWRSWNVLLAGAVIAPGAAGAGDLPAPGTLFEQQLNAVRDEMQRTAFPDADKVARLAGEARASLRTQAQIAPDGTILNAGGGPLGFEGFLAAPATSRDGHVSWEYCCQQLGAWLAAERSLRDSLAIPQRGAVVPVEALGHLNMLRGRARRVGESLRFITSGREWPRALAALQPGGSVAENTLSLDQAALELEALWRELGNP
jgi:mono/diheme cytochrome c family protein